MSILDNTSLANKTEQTCVVERQTLLCHPVIEESAKLQVTVTSGNRPYAGVVAHLTVGASEGRGALALVPAEVVNVDVEVGDGHDHFLTTARVLARTGRAWHWTSRDRMMNFL